MKTLNFLIALIILISIACTPENSGNEHGHEHTTEEHGHPHEEGSDDHSHEHDEHHEQEEFIIKSDSTQVEIDSARHTHRDGSKHHDH